MIRKNFPKRQESYDGGASDGWCFHIDFWSHTDEKLLEIIREFLDKEGYSDVPLPKTAERLMRDYLKPDAKGIPGKFIWHPIMICTTPYREDALSLYIYNEEHPEHESLWKNAVIDE